MGRTYPLPDACGKQYESDKKSNPTWSCCKKDRFPKKAREHNTGRLWDGEGKKKAQFNRTCSAPPSFSFGTSTRFHAQKLARCLAPADAKAFSSQPKIVPPSLDPRRAAPAESFVAIERGEVCVAWKLPCQEIVRFTDVPKGELTLTAYLLFSGAGVRLPSSRVRRVAAARSAPLLQHALKASAATSFTLRCGAEGRWRLAAPKKVGLGVAGADRCVNYGYRAPVVVERDFGGLVRAPLNGPRQVLLKCGSIQGGFVVAELVCRNLSTTVQAARCHPLAISRVLFEHRPTCEGEPVWHRKASGGRPGMAPGKLCQLPQEAQRQGQARQATFALARVRPMAPGPQAPCARLLVAISVLSVPAPAKVNGPALWHDFEGGRWGRDAVKLVANLVRVRVRSAAVAWERRWWNLFQLPSSRRCGVVAQLPPAPLGIGAEKGPPLEHVLEPGAVLAALPEATAAEINAFDAEGQSLLVWGAGRGLTSFCQRLLEHHHFRDTTLRTPSAAGETAIHAAAKHGWASTLLALLNHPRSKRLAAARSAAGGTALHCAAKEGHAMAVKALLDCPGFEANMQDHGGHTALHLAAGQGHAMAEMHQLPAACGWWIFSIRRGVLPQCSFFPNMPRSKRVGSAGQDAPHAAGTHGRFF
ncbi:unnamed protein product [Effrenium voratum]|uniref:Uncharacterized protein n=1 Tax=Effrenium voratum TaxID=2562239 RepID=A0AA36MLN9_9DINO|nr:unnamed protein product [Effrenium voratum]